jgi:hypothetical protein
MFDGETAIDGPSVPPTLELIPHNQLTAHLFHVLTGCQAMQRLQVIPGKHCTIHSLLQSEFPPIKSTNNTPTPYVTPKTIGYIHGLLCDSITLYQSDTFNARALRNESMILGELENEEPAVFRQELYTTLEHYYEVIQGLPNAGGRPKPATFKLKMKSAKARAAETAGGESAEEQPPPPPPAGGGGAAEPPAAEAAAAPAAPAAGAAGKRGKGGGKA